MSNVRRQWETAVRTDRRWPSTCRVVRGTLLALAAEMRADGVIRQRPRAVLAARVGLPERTLNRHLARAVQMGWLSHRRGQKYVPAEYRAAIPAVSGCQQWPAETGSQHATRSCPENPSQHATWWPTHIEESERMREHDAVDEGRERRADHDGSRAGSDHDDKDGSNEEQAGTRLPVGVAGFRWEPTRPIGAIVVYGAGSSVTRAREAAA